MKNPSHCFWKNWYPPPLPCSNQKYGREGCANGDISDVVGRWEDVREGQNVALDQDSKEVESIDFEFGQ